MLNQLKTRSRRTYMNLKTPDSTHLTARIKEIEYQLIKNLNWIPTDDQFVKIAASILHAALGNETSLVGAQLPTSFAGCTLDWSQGTLDDTNVKITKGSKSIIVNVQTNDNETPVSGDYRLTFQVSGTTEYEQFQTSENGFNTQTNQFELKCGFNNNLYGWNGSLPIAALFPDGSIGINAVATGSSYTQASNIQINSSLQLIQNGGDPGVVGIKLNPAVAGTRPASRDDTNLDLFDFFDRDTNVTAGEINIIRIDTLNKIFEASFTLPPEIGKNYTITGYVLAPLTIMPALPNM